MAGATSAINAGAAGNHPGGDQVAADHLTGGANRLRRSPQDRHQPSGAGLGTEGSLLSAIPAYIDPWPLSGGWAVIRLRKDGNPEAVLELAADCRLITTPPTGGETSHRNSRLLTRLQNWADRRLGWLLFA